MLENSKEPKSLEEILQLCFGCKNPFRKTPICTGVEPDGNKKYDQMTKAGWKAYDKLVSCLYALEHIGALETGEANDIIEELDSIVSENGAYTG